MQKVKRAACDEEEGKRKTCTTDCPKIGENLCVISRPGGMALISCDDIDQSGM